MARPMPTRCCWPALNSIGNWSSTRSVKPSRTTTSRARASRSARDSQDSAGARSHDSDELAMQTVSTIGLDIGKSLFQVHGIDAAGQVVIRRQLNRRYLLAFFEKLPPCLIGIEACASSHHWSRELRALGHTVRLMPPAYVKPYVKRQKNDMADAEAICEAVTRANMRFVPTKTPEQQSCLMLHRTRHLFIRQQTAVINSIRAHFAEFGIVAPVGLSVVMMNTSSLSHTCRRQSCRADRSSPFIGIVLPDLPLLA